MDDRVAANTPRKCIDLRPGIVGPLLASQLISDEELDEMLDGAWGSGTRRKRRDELNLLGTGVRSLDDTLEGGLESGRVVSIGSEASSGGNELCRTLLVSSLFKNDNSTAAVIDTSGNFDILRLYTLIVSHLDRNPDTLTSLRSRDAASDPGAKIEDVAAKVLDRVKIMRVFDFEGIREAIGEISDTLEGTRAPTSKGGDEVDTPHVVDEIAQPVIKPPQRRTVVLDSEDEEDEEDEEMLFDSETTVMKPISPAPAVQDPETKQHPELPHTKPSQEHSEPEENQAAKVKFILIDNLASFINPLLKKDYVQAHALSTSFLTTLTNLTHTHNLYTILVNPTSTPRPSSSPTSTSTRHTPQNPGQAGLAAPPPTIMKQLPTPPSIFASSIAVPGLTHVLGRYVDMGLLVTRVPRRKLDARVLYSDFGGGSKSKSNSMGARKGKEPEMVSVMEVMSDRWKGRVGAWGTFIESGEIGGMMMDVS